MGRIGEVATLKWGQIMFDSEYATVTLESKTGIPRKVPLYTSHVSLKHWMAYSSSNGAPDKYIFHTMDSKGNKSLSYDGVRVIIKKAQIKAGIEKNVTPHIFRHTRITDLLRIGTSESAIKMVAWGTVSTDMLRVYAHLTSTDAEKEMNKVLNILQGEKVAKLPDIAMPVRCEGCGLVNPKSSRFCSACGSPLSSATKCDYEMLVDFLQRNNAYDEIMNLMNAKMKEEK